MREIEFNCGDTIEECVNKINKCVNNDVYGVFNGQKFYPETTLDEAYLMVTGLTKLEKDRKDEESRVARIKKDKEFQESIPSLIEGYEDRAVGVLKPSEFDYWCKIIPIRLSDMYNGMELDCTLSIGELLIDKKYEEAEELFRNQGHSGMSHGLVCLMVKRFCFNGEDFITLINGEK